MIIINNDKVIEFLNQLKQKAQEEKIKRNIKNQIKQELKEY